MKKKFINHTGTAPTTPPKPPEPEFRTPTACDRLAAIADAEIKAWVDAYDRHKASHEKANAATQEIMESHKALQETPLARNPAYKSRLDMRYNPLANDEDICIPRRLDMRFNPLACDEDFFLPQRDVA